MLILSPLHQCLGQIARNLGIGPERLSPMLSNPLEESDIALIRFYAIFHKGLHCLLLVLGLIPRLHPALRSLDMALECLYAIGEAILDILERAILNIKSTLHNSLTGFIPELPSFLYRFGGFVLFHYLIPFFVA